MSAAFALSGLTAAVLLPSTALAIQPPDQLRGRGDLELRSPSTKLPRADAAGDWRSVLPGARGQALGRLQTELGGDALTRFDRDTGVLDTLIPNGFAVADASRSPAAAEAFARSFLARHLDLLAPGASASDFVQVSDVVHGGVRSIGFVQTHQGKAVIGGQISFAFKADRLVAVRSLALPTITTKSAGAAIDAAQAVAAARRWIADDFAAASLSSTRAEVSAVEGPMILPLLSSTGGGTGFGKLDYREVLAVDVRMDGGSDRLPGHWLVWVDAHSGEVLARRSLIRWAELKFDVWQRSPVLGNRVQLPAKHLGLSIGGQPGATDAQGQFTVPGPGTSVDIGLEGAFARIFNDAGTVSSLSMPFDPGTSFTWDLSAADETDAQLNAYVHTQMVKDYVRLIDPDFEVPLTQTTVTVNIADICNAFADQDTLNFFSAGGGCENSALISDVVFHEYGHVVHTLGLIPGVGVFDGAISEGVSDYLSATMVNDPRVGVGFFFDQEPIRDLDPQGFEWHWPEDKGEVHDEGRIIGGTLWDL
ncbi:MAG: hypothetical protein KC431_01490, partial [Myxococcales bacterium]|nr:hypothetical protein [Myxococcales bacterium]